MSFVRQPDGSLLGCGPDADYPGREYAVEHWRKIRADIAERHKTGAPSPDWRPPMTLVEQANRQIAILERDLAEWRKIRDAGETNAGRG